MSRSYANGLFHQTTLIRTGLSGQSVVCRVMVFFEVESSIPHYRGSHTTGEVPECVYEFVSAAFDPAPPIDAPGPLTRDELTGLMEWFYINHATSGGHANDNEDSQEAA